MAQSALTVTPPSPTPPTNLVNAGSTPPNPGTFDPTVYFQVTTNDVHYPRPELAPFYDDGIATVGTVNEGALSVVAFAANKAALAVAGTSVAHEGAGTETVVTAAVANPSPHGQLRQFSCLGNRTSSPNETHASYLSGATLPTITGVSAGGVSGTGTTLLTVTGTNYTRASIVYVDGVMQTTNYTSATVVTVTNAPKKATAGNRAVTVQNGAGGPTTAPTNWVFS